MKRSVILLLALILAFGTQKGVVGQNSSAYEISAQSSVEEIQTENGWERTIVNHWYSFTSFYSSKDEKIVEVLISQKLKTTTKEGLEGQNSILTVDAFVSGKKKYDTTLWSITDYSDNGEIWGDFYKTTKYGCCGAEDFHRYFDLKTGKQVVSFSGEIAQLEIPNIRIKRIFLYHSANACVDFPEIKIYRDVIGMLTFSAYDSLISRIILLSKDGELAWTPDIHLFTPKEGMTNNLTLWSSNGNATKRAVSYFEIRITFYEGMVISIPIVNDDFDLRNAQIPEGITIEYLAQDETRNIK